MKLKINREYSFSKIGIDEVDGLKCAMKDVMQPILDAVNEHIYWTKAEFNESEYKSRDGFIPYSDNCGGIEITTVIPSCERDNFEYLVFGECDDEECDHEQECVVECEGRLDAKLRVWLKFEGLNEQNKMQFYLYLGGGNGDEPYFRTKYEATVFESEFQAKTIAEFKREAKKHVTKLLEIMSA